MRFFKDQKEFSQLDLQFLFRVFAATQAGVSLEDPILLLETFPHIVRFKPAMGQSPNTSSIRKEGDSMIGFYGKPPKVESSFSKFELAQNEVEPSMSSVQQH